MIYNTDFKNISVGNFGWTKISELFEITNRPLIDIHTGLFARATYENALLFAESIEAKLPTRDEVLHSLLESRSKGTLLRPITLSYGAEMKTLPQYEIHDKRVVKQIKDLNLSDENVFIGNIGKHWVAGAANNKARICGWLQRNGTLIQMGVVDNHNNKHFDYATTTLLVRKIKKHAHLPAQELPSNNGQLSSDTKNKINSTVSLAIDKLTR